MSSDAKGLTKLQYTAFKCVKVGTLERVQEHDMLSVNLYYAWLIPKDFAARRFFYAEDSVLEFNNHVWISFWLHVIFEKQQPREARSFTA